MRCRRQGRWRRRLNEFQYGVSHRQARTPSLCPSPFLFYLFLMLAISAAAAATAAVRSCVEMLGKSLKSLHLMAVN